MLAPGPRHHLHTDRQARAALLDVVSRLLDPVARLRAPDFLASSNTRPRHYTGRVPKQIIEHVIATSENQILPRPMRPGRQRCRRAEHDVEWPAGVVVQRLGEAPLVLDLR